MPDLKLPESIDAKTWFDEPPAPRTEAEEADDAARATTTIAQLVERAAPENLESIELVWHDAVDELKAGED